MKWPFYQRHVNLIHHKTYQNLALPLFEDFVRISLVVDLSLIQLYWLYLDLCNINLDDSVDSGNFSVNGYLHLNWKDSVTHVNGLAVYVKKGLLFAWDVSLENSQDSYLCFRLALLHLVSCFPFLYWSISLCTVFDAASSNIDIDEALLINPSTNVFFLGDFSVRHENWLTYSDGTDRPDKLCYIFSISNGLTQMVTRIPDCNSRSPVVVDLSIFSDANICFTVVFLSFGNSGHGVVSISIDCLSNSKGVPLFIVHFMTTLVQTGMIFVIIWQMSHERIRLNCWCWILWVSSS